METVSTIGIEPLVRELNVEPPAAIHAGSGCRSGEPESAPEERRAEAPPLGFRALRGPRAVSRRRADSSEASVSGIVGRHDGSCRPFRRGRPTRADAFVGGGGSEK